MGNDADPLHPQDVSRRLQRVAADDLPALAVGKKAARVLGRGVGPNELAIQQQADRALLRRRIADFKLVSPCVREVYVPLDLVRSADIQNDADALAVVLRVAAGVTAVEFYGLDLHSSRYCLCRTAFRKG